MITWMQRHKKYLIITVWVSTIAFVGAGFVGWGQYSYGDKAGAVAKVGSVEISMSELQKSYSNLYNQYNKIFQGDFDEEKAKSFGLQSQALKQLTDQALILNLAKSYDLQISNTELLTELKAQEFFFQDGVFNKEIYKKMLSRNNLNMKEYEADLKKQLLIQKTLKLIPVNKNENETNILNTVTKIADKINYKVLDESKIIIDTSDKSLKPYWGKMQQSFMTEVSYNIEFIKQNKVSKEYDDAKINKYYAENRTHFKDSDGKILPLEKTKTLILAELNAKATKDAALRAYIAYKKGKLSPDVKKESSTISLSNNPYTEEALQKISKLSNKLPFMKPVLVNDTYFTFKLIKINPSMPKTYKEAKKELLPLYIAKEKEIKLLKLAQDSVNTFSGTITDFILSTDAIKLKDIPTPQANEFLKQLFTQQNKHGYIKLSNGNIVLYDILEQKLLNKTNNNQEDIIVKLKTTMFSKGLIKTLQNKYETKIFIQGL